MPRPSEIPEVTTLNIAQIVRNEIERLLKEGKSVDEVTKHTAIFWGKEGWEVLRKYYKGDGAYLSIHHRQLDTEYGYEVKPI